MNNDDAPEKMWGARVACRASARVIDFKLSVFGSCVRAVRTSAGGGQNKHEEEEEILHAGSI